MTDIDYKAIRQALMIIEKIDRKCDDASGMVSCQSPCVVIYTFDTGLPEALDMIEDGLVDEDDSDHQHMVYVPGRATRAQRVRFKVMVCQEED